jgi:hypothetical protein
MWERIECDETLLGTKFLGTVLLGTSWAYGVGMLMAWTAFKNTSAG